jgi:NADH:ubiquinone oxidoreductase subunit 2 (subunit N)
MDAPDILALLPLILIAATSIFVMLGIATKRSHALAMGLTLAGLAAAFISLLAAAPLVRRQVTSLLLLDRYALFYLGLIIASSAVVAVFSYRYFERTGWPARRAVYPAPHRDARLRGAGGEQSLCFVSAWTRDPERRLVRDGCLRYWP